MASEKEEMDELVVMMQKFEEDFMGLLNKCERRDDEDWPLVKVFVADYLASILIRLCLNENEKGEARRRIQEAMDGAMKMVLRALLESEKTVA